MRAPCSVEVTDATLYNPQYLCFTNKEKRFVTLGSFESFEKTLFRYNPGQDPARTLRYAEYSTVPLKNIRKEQESLQVSRVQSRPALVNRFCSSKSFWNLRKCRVP